MSISSIDRCIRTATVHSKRLFADSITPKQVLSRSPPHGNRLHRVVEISRERCSRTPERGLGRKKPNEHVYQREARKREGSRGYATRGGQWKGQRKLA